MTDHTFRLSKQDVEAFVRDGVLCLRSVIGSPLLERLQKAALAARDLPGGFWFKIYLWRHNDDFEACCRGSVFPRIAAELLKTPKVNLLYDQLFEKKPRMEPTPWHNDLGFWPIEGTSVMSFWLALSEVSAANGGLEFIRGSHLWSERFETFEVDYEVGRVLDEVKEQDDRTVPMPDFEAARDDYDIVAYELAPGDAIAFHALTVHHAPGNQTDTQPRLGYAMRYTGADVRYRLAPGMNERVFNPDLSPGDPMDSDQYPVVYETL